jgi:hypothetical protein
MYFSYIIIKDENEVRLFYLHQIYLRFNFKKVLLLSFLYYRLILENIDPDDEKCN